SHLFNRLISTGEGLCKPGEMISHYEHVNRLVVRVLCSLEIDTYHLQKCRILYTLQSFPSFRIWGLADDASWAVTDILFNVPVYMRPEETLAGQAPTAELPLMTRHVGSVLANSRFQ